MVAQAHAAQKSKQASLGDSLVGDGDAADIGDFEAQVYIPKPPSSSASKKPTSAHRMTRYTLTLYS